MIVCVRSQNSRLNFEWSRKQSSDVIPASKYLFQTSEPKKKLLEPGELIPLSDWGVRTFQRVGDDIRAAEKSVFAQDLDTSDWYSATVSGTVLTTLVDQGIYPDPYWGLNNLLIPDTLCRME